MEAIVGRREGSLFISCDRCHIFIRPLSSFSSEHIRVTLHFVRLLPDAPEAYTTTKRELFHHPPLCSLSHIPFPVKQNDGVHTTRKAPCQKIDAMPVFFLANGSEYELHSTLWEKASTRGKINCFFQERNHPQNKKNLFQDHETLRGEEANALSNRYSRGERGFFFDSVD